MNLHCVKPQNRLPVLNGQRRRRTGQGAPDAFTLLEVILAIAILAISLAAIGIVVRSAFGNAQQAADGLEAQMVAQSIMDELKCGTIELADQGPIPMDNTLALGNWAVEIRLEPTIAAELVQVRVLVGRTLEPNDRPQCELVRWFPNPDYALPATAL